MQFVSISKEFCFIFASFYAIPGEYKDEQFEPIQNTGVNNFQPQKITKPPPPNTSPKIKELEDEDAFIKVRRSTIGSDAPQVLSQQSNHFDRRAMSRASDHLKLQAGDHK